jgi:hypothetical protein
VNPQVSDLASQLDYIRQTPLTVSPQLALSPLEIEKARATLVEPLQVCADLLERHLRVVDVRDPTVATV